MITFANAKINLGLQILNKRPDGYHNISSIMVPIPFQDVIEILPNDELRLEILGKEVPGDLSDNLMMKAYHLLHKDFKLDPVHMILKKNIAMGAGLGGGSADATAVLTSLNEMFKLGLSSDELRAYAGKLGMDCPFFVSNAPQIARERGDILQEVNLDLKGLHLLLICPTLHVSTAQAYGGVEVEDRPFPLDSVLNKDWSSCREVLVNDFEKSVFSIHSSLGQIKKDLYEAGAVYAAMSGSGSAMFGLFETEPEVKISDFPQYGFKF